MTDWRALVAQPGANDTEYHDPGLPGRPITLRSVTPRGWTPAMPVLFVHHGVLRNGGDYRDFWLPLVDAAGLLVVAPEFSAESFPGSPWYNFGNREDAAGQAKPKEQWTYGVDGRVHAGLQRAGLAHAGRFGLFGHSAGGQFVHRMVSLGFTDGVAAAVTANAGTYAMPDLGTPFPYGLGGTGVGDDALRTLLRFPLTIMAGTDDLDTASEHFPKEPPAMAQGPTRYARAHAYAAAAKRHGAPCAWSIVDVPGVGHDGERMSAAAAPLLAAALHGTGRPSPS